MVRKVLHSFYLDPDLAEALREASDSEYMPQSQIVRSAIRDWLEGRGYITKRPSRKGGKRKR